MPREQLSHRLPAPGFRLLLPLLVLLLGLLRLLLPAQEPAQCDLTPQPLDRFTVRCRGRVVGEVVRVGHMPCDLVQIVRPLHVREDDHEATQSARDPLDRRAVDQNYN